jgi:hypothetical protein
MAPSTGRISDNVCAWALDAALLAAPTSSSKSAATKKVRAISIRHSKSNQSTEKSELRCLYAFFPALFPHQTHFYGVTLYGHL